VRREHPRKKMSRCIMGAFGRFGFRKRHLKLKTKENALRGKAS